MLHEYIYECLQIHLLESIFKKSLAFNNVSYLPTN